MAKTKTKRRKLYFDKKALAILAATTLIAGSVAVAKREVSAGETVTQVLDGDSFKIGSKDQTVRFLSLDSPETKYCYGEEAKENLEKKILGKKVILKELQTDRYGRIMALVYQDGELINEYLIKNGLALHLWDNTNEKTKKILESANNFARENRLGIFSPKCYQIEPPDSKCTIKGSVNPATKEMTYTMPTCDRYNLTVVEKYKGEEWFCNESAAKKAGFVKSKNCK